MVIWTRCDCHGHSTLYACEMGFRASLRYEKKKKKKRFVIVSDIPVKDVSTHSDFICQFKLVTLSYYYKIKGSSGWELSQFQLPEATKSVAQLPLKQDDIPLHLPPLPHNFIRFLQNFFPANLLRPQIINPPFLERLGTA